MKLKTFHKDLRAGFTLKRKGDSEAGFMETYICRYSRRMGYIRCPKVNEPCNTTHNLRNKVKDFLENPLLDDESWVPLSEIDDSGEGPVRITIIFGTNKTIENLKFSETFHCDATYRLTWNRYPVFVCGVTNETGKFFPCFAVLSSHEDSLSWRKVFEFVHSYNGGTHFKYFMGDGAKSITKAWSEVTFTFTFHQKHYCTFCGKNS